MFYKPFGNLGGTHSGLSDAFLMKYDSLGNRLLERHWGRSNDGGLGVSASFLVLALEALAPPTLAGWTSLVSMTLPEDVGFDSLGPMCTRRVFACRPTCWVTCLLLDTPMEVWRLV